MVTRSAPKWATLWGFFVATYAASWLLWAPAIALRGQGPSLLFVVLGAFVPSSAGVLFTYLTQGAEGRREFWNRTIDPRRIGWRWWGVIALLYPVVNVLAMLLVPLFGDSPPALNDLAENLLSPALIVQLVLADFVVSGFSEELGWRGFALDRLQERQGPLVASLVLGLVHGLWHLPLFFVPGITQGEMGLLSLGALAFYVGTVAGSVTFTWVYNSTRRSILSAVLLHFVANLCLDLLVGLQGAPPSSYFVAYTGALILVDVFIVVSKPAALSRIPTPILSRRALRQAAADSAGQRR